MKASRSMAFWVLAVVLVIILVQAYEQNKKSKITDFDYPQFRKALESEKIKSITFKDVGSGGEIGEIKGVIRDKYADELGGKEFNIVGNIGRAGSKTS